MRTLGVIVGALLGWLAVAGSTTSGLNDTWYRRGRDR